MGKEVANGGDHELVLCDAPQTPRLPQRIASSTHLSSRESYQMSRLQVVRHPLNLGRRDPGVGVPSMCAEHGHTLCCAAGLPHNTCGTRFALAQGWWPLGGGGPCHHGLVVPDGPRDCPLWEAREAARTHRPPVALSASCTAFCTIWQTNGTSIQAAQDIQASAVKGGLHDPTGPQPQWPRPRGSGAAETV